MVGLLTKIAKAGMDIRVIVWIKEFLSDRTQRVRVDGKRSEEFRVTSGVRPPTYWGLQGNQMQ
jgi:hypothetical protein